MAAYEFACANGAGPAVLTQAKLSREDLEDRDHRIPLSRYLALVGAARRACRDQAFALHFGAAVDSAEYSVVPLIGGTSATVAAGLAEMNHYARLMVDASAAEERFRFARDRTGTWIVDTLLGYPDVTESTFARFAAGGRRFARGGVILEVEVAHPRPRYAEEYVRVLGAPVRFRAGRNALRINPAILDEPVAPQAGYARDVFLARANRLLQELPVTTRSEVEKHIGRAPELSAVSMSRVASAMHVTRQTLFRRLRDEGTTFESVRDEWRRTMAMHHLSTSGMTVSEAAHLVGFSDASAFSRAFKRWMGMAPSEYRRRRDG